MNMLRNIKNFIASATFLGGLFLLLACGQQVGGGGSTPGSALGSGPLVVAGGENIGLPSAATGNSDDGSGTQAVGGGDPGGQPSAPTVPAPKRWHYNIQVEFEPSFRDGIVATTGESEQQKQLRRAAAEFSEANEFEIVGGPFQGNKPLVTQWREGMTEAEYSIETDEWGWVRMKYTQLSSAGKPCIDNFTVQACYSDGSKYYQSDSVRVECPQKNESPQTVKLFLRLRSTALACPPSNSIVIDPSNLFFAE